MSNLNIKETIVIGAVVGAVALAVTVTPLLAPRLFTPHVPPPPLKAEVSLNGLDLKVTNNDSFDWKNCIVRTNILSVKLPGYRLDVAVIPRGHTVTLDALKFKAGINGEGEPWDDPRFFLNTGITCDTPNGHAIYAKVFDEHVKKAAASTEQAAIPICRDPPVGLRRGEKLSAEDRKIPLCP